MFHSRLTKHKQYCVSWNIGSAVYKFNYKLIIAKISIDFADRKINMKSCEFITMPVDASIFIWQSFYIFTIVGPNSNKSTWKQYREIRNKSGKISTSAICDVYRCSVLCLYFYANYLSVFIRVVYFIIFFGFAIGDQFVHSGLCSVRHSNCSLIRCLILFHHQHSPSNFLAIANWSGQFGCVHMSHLES